MSKPVIYIKGRQYRYYCTCYSWTDCLHKIRRLKAKNKKTKYFTLKDEGNWMFPQTRYHLYLKGRK